MFLDLDYLAFHILGNVIKTELDLFLFYSPIHSFPSITLLLPTFGNLFSQSHRGLAIRFATVGMPPSPVSRNDPDLFPMSSFNTPHYPLTTSTAQPITTRPRSIDQCLPLLFSQTFRRAFIRYRLLPSKKVLVDIF